MRIKLPTNRKGDNAPMSIIEFVDYELSEHDEDAAPSKGKGSLMDRAKGVFGGGTKKGAEEVEAEADEVEAEATAAEDEAEPDEIEASEPDTEAAAESATDGPGDEKKDD